MLTGEFRPSDEHETAMPSAGCAYAKTTTFKIVADYGNGEIEEKETPASILTYGTGTPRTPNGSEKIGDDWNDLSLFKAKPEEFDLEGTLDRVFNELSDRIQDHQVQGIQSLEISVGQVMDWTTSGTGVIEKINPCAFSNGSQSITDQSFSGIDLRSLLNAIATLAAGIAEIESAGSGDYKAVGIHTCADGGLNCGRALGRYQFMSYNPYAVQLIAAKPGGQEFLSQVEQGHQPTEAEVFKFFPPADQDRAFMADMANKIQVTQEQIDPATGQPFTGDSPSLRDAARTETLRERLIERVAQKHFGGDYSKVDGNGSDALGRLSLKDYGKTALASYRNSNSDNGTLTCSPNVNSSYISTAKNTENGR